MRRVSIDEFPEKNDDSDNEDVNPGQQREQIGESANPTTIHDDNDCSDLTPKELRSWFQLGPEISSLDEEIQNDLKRLSEAETALVEKNQELYEFLTKLSEKPEKTQQAVPAANLRFVAVSRAWCDVVDEYARFCGNDAEQFIAGIASRYVNEDVGRTDLYKILTPGVKYYNSSLNDFKNTTREAIAIYQETDNEMDIAVKVAKDLMGSAMTIDGQILFDGLLAAHFESAELHDVGGQSAGIKVVDSSVFDGEVNESSSQENIGRGEQSNPKNRLARIGNRALRVAEIAAGVFLGMAATAVVRRKS